MKYRYIIMMLIGLSAVSVNTHTAYGQSLDSETTLDEIDMKKNVIIFGTVCNSLTRATIKDAQVILEHPDKEKADTFLIKDGEDSQIMDYHYTWNFVVPRKKARVKVSITAKGYEPRTQEIQVAPKGKKIVVYLGDIRLRRERNDIKLGEATVKATMVKFYTKNDTLVFNADAFQLSDGSMLDALIRQLPGVELKDDGRILVNGRYVESLLLNGEEFFDDKREIMLDNFPSYMVQNVQVYDKSSRLSETIGHDVEEKQLVMDVKLKRQYQVGWLANAEAGYGSEERYLGRFFGLRFTPQSRLSLFGNLNNVNERRRPGENGEWTPSSMTGGLDATKMFGLDYQVKDIDKRFEIQGNAQVDHTDQDRQTRESGETFLPGGNTFSRRQTLSDNCQTSLSTQHRLNLHWNYVDVELVPSLSYRRWRNLSYDGSAEFSSDPDDYFGTGLLDSLMRPGYGEQFRCLALNKTWKESLSRGHELTGKLSWQTLFSFSTTEDRLMFSGQFNYDDRHEDRFQRYWLDYPQEGSQTDFRNQWFKDRPNRDYGYSARAEYIHLFGQNYNSTLRPFYEFMQKFTDRDYLLYRLDELGGEWGQDTDTPLGALPSETDYLLDEVADRQNSYRNRYIETEHRTGVDVYWCRTPSEGREWVVSGTLPLRFQRKRTRYTQASIENGLQSRSAIFFEPSLNLQYFWSGQRRNIRFHYDVSSMSPNPVSLFDVEDSSDPLNISRGNPGLGNLHTHNLQLTYESRNTTSQHFMGAFIRYRITQNAIAYGSTYDRETGVRVTRPENVDGNYRLDGDFTYSLPLDKAKRLLLGTQTNVNFQNSVDLARVADAPASSRSTVQTLQLGETLKLDYRMGKVKLGAKAGGTWTRAGGSRQDFSTVNAGDFNYGVTAQLELPWDMQLYTDLTQYSRRGYDDSGMNTDDLVWNARLSKRLMKGRLTLMLDGFDILQNLSNITRSLDAQGRVETWRNVIPRYVMLHAVYRFSVQPKKKPGE